MAMETSPDLSPIGQSERIVALDSIRAMALFGVILMHVDIISGAAFLVLMGRIARHTGAARWILDIGYVLFATKSLTVFSLLFAIGLFIQFERTSAKGIGTWSFAIRRLGALAIIGLANYVLSWDSDILFTYALLGVLLTCFVKAKPRILLMAGVVGFVAWQAKPVLMNILNLAAGWSQEGMVMNLLVAKVQVYGVGTSWADAVAFRFHTFFGRWNVAEQSDDLLWMLPVFMAGAWLWRKGIIRDAAGNRIFLGRLFHSTFWVGLALSAAFYLPLPLIRDGWYAVARGVPMAALNTLAGFLLALGYFSGLLLVLNREGPWRRWAVKVAPMGRMALTNYLLHSLIMTWLFYRHGLGLYGRTGVFTNLAIAIGLFAGLAGWSHWWLAHFIFGPAEWLWRSMTYGRLQPMLKPNLPVGPEFIVENI